MSSGKLNTWALRGTESASLRGRFKYLFKRSATGFWSSIRPRAAVKESWNPISQIQKGCQDSRRMAARPRKAVPSARRSSTCPRSTPAPKRAARHTEGRTPQRMV